MVVEMAVACYVDNVIFLVERLDFVCSEGDNRDERAVEALNGYLNVCVRRAEAIVERK